MGRSGLQRIGHLICDITVSGRDRIWTPVWLTFHDLPMISLDYQRGHPGSEIPTTLIRFVGNWWALGGKVGDFPALMWSVEYSPMICDFLHGLAIEDFNSFFQIPSLYSIWASKMWALWGQRLISVVTSVLRTMFHTVGFSKCSLKKYQI